MMYALPEYEHIPNNKIVRQYREAIVELVSEHPVVNVSVQMILDKTETSRGTFYKYFPDKFALINYIYYLDAIERDKKPMLSAVDTESIYTDKMDFYKNVFAYEGQNSFREFYRHFYSYNYKINFIKFYGEKAYTPFLEGTIKFYLDGQYSMKRDWILSGCTSLSATEINEICLNAVPPIILNMFKKQAP